MAAVGTDDVRTRRRDQTRQEIVAAAWRLAERDGIAGLSLRDLAGEVGMRAPSLYTYFSSKAAMYDAMFAAGYRELDAAMHSVRLDPDTPVEAVASSISAFVAFCCASVPRYQLMFTRAVPNWEPSADAYAASLASYAGMTERLAVLGIDRTEDIDLLTALISGLAAQQVANDLAGDRWVRLADGAAAMFMSHVRSR